MARKNKTQTNLAEWVKYSEGFKHPRSVQLVYARSNMRVSCKTNNGTVIAIAHGYGYDRIDAIFHQLMREIVPAWQWNGSGIDGLIERAATHGIKIESVGFDVYRISRA